MQFLCPLFKVVVCATAARWTSVFVFTDSAIPSVFTDSAIPSVFTDSAIPSVFTDSAIPSVFTDSHSLCVH